MYTPYPITPNVKIIVERRVGAEAKGIAKKFTTGRMQRRTSCPAKMLRNILMVVATIG